MNGGWWTGDEWRWGLRSTAPSHTIAVIEPPDDQKRDDPKAVKVPFGFGRVLAKESEPLVWEGDGA